jgi:hypothetical protein
MLGCLPLERAALLSRNLPVQLAYYAERRHFPARSLAAAHNTA